MQKLFATLEKGIKTKEGKLFQSNQNIKGYVSNLMGNSGIAEKDVYKQAIKNGF